MKKLISILISLAFILALVPMTASAASGSLTGTDTVRAGDTVKLTFKVIGSEKFSGYSGTFSYDSSVATLVSVANTMTGWNLTPNGNNILAYNETSTEVVMGTVFVATFKINNGVPVGTDVSIKFYGDFSGAEDSSRQTLSAGYSTKVAAPLSSDATLKSLAVANGKLSPAFNPNTTSYSCGTVGFEISKLSITANAAANGAAVSINGANLSVGENKVSIVVTAPDGTKKTYTITVTREQDPNYVPSKNVALAEVSLSSGQLSPEFTADRKEYVVYLPFEVTKLSITGVAADPLAKGVENVEDESLKVGLNTFKIKCIAEDGTEGIYTFNVVRMDQFAGLASIAIPGNNEPQTPEPTEPVVEEKTGADGVSPILLAILGVSCLVFGFTVGMLIFRNRMPKKVTPFLNEAFGAPDQVDDIDEEVMKYFDK